ncbi:MAG: YlxR family protein [Clostridia bacterium]|nr:YlxR family protein [Clostridia bacterium]
MRNVKPTLRMCSGCMERKDKKQLVRVVKTPEGKIMLDTTGKLNGRGAYICKSTQCFSKALKAHRFEKVFDCSLNEDVISDINRELTADET